MQLLLKGGTSGTMPITTTAVYLPLTQPVLAAGTVGVAAQVEIPVGLHADLRAMLAYRWFATDDSQSAGSWVDVGATVQSGPGKVFCQGTINAVNGLMIQLGVKLYTSVGTQNGRGRLSYPVVVTT